MSSSSDQGVSRGQSLRAAPVFSRQLLIGAALAVSAALLLLLGAALDLELDAVVLLGVALGAVIALAPDATPTTRLAAFGGGVVAAWLGYLMRAALLPDTTGGRAVAALVVIALCVGLVALSLGRLPLWGVLVGTGALVGTYESTFAADPALVLDTSVTALTALLLCAALGWLVGTLAQARQDSAAAGPRVPELRRADTSEHTDAHHGSDTMEAVR